MDLSPLVALAGVVAALAAAALAHLLLLRREARAEPVRSDPTARLYRPPYTRCDEPPIITEFIRQNSFATLVAAGRGGEPLATHIPLMLEACDRAPSGFRLVGHVALGNMIWRALEEARAPALAVFLGAHSYVSPVWYEHPSKEVPTWNYAAVHARGATRLLHDEDEKRRILRTLVGANEVDRVACAAAPERERRYATDEVEEPVMRTQLARIVFFEMLVEHFDGKLKLSQNKSDRDQHSVANALAAGALGAAGRDVADLMRAHCPALRAQKR